MVGGLVAANSSTILTHLNWGASYLVHDFYRRFVRPGEADSHYVGVGRIATVLLFIASAGVVYLLDTAKDAFDLLLQIGAGTGLLYLVRWFWWRVNAWCEVVAMASSFLVSVGFLVLARAGIDLGTHVALVITVAVTTVCWLATAYLGPETDRRVLVDFYARVRPPGPGWAPVRAAAERTGVPVAASPDNVPLALAGWAAGCTVIWSSLFTVGNFLYGRHAMATFLLLVFAASGLVLLGVMRRLWTPASGGRDAAQ
jgi:hypothetical protein